MGDYYLTFWEFCAELDKAVGTDMVALHIRVIREMYKNWMSVEEVAKSIKMAYRQDKFTQENETHPQCQDLENHRC